MKGKRGVSEVVTAILLILLAVAAVIIVWGVVRGILKAPTATSGCASIELSITKVIPYVAGVSFTKVTVERNTNLAGEVDLSKIAFVFQNSNGTVSRTDKDSSLTELGGNTFTFSATESATGLAKVTIYPIILTESGDKLCDKPVSWTA